LGRALYLISICSGKVRSTLRPQRIWRFILKSHRFYILLFPVAIWLALIGVREITRDFGSARLYDKDFISPYLMARAILAGANPYLPIPQLAATYLNLPNYTYFSHSTPHPPLLGLLFLPFGFLSYKTGFAVWIGIEMILLFLFLLALRRWFNFETILQPILALLFLMYWSPMRVEMRWGQVNLLTLLLLTWSLIWLEKGREYMSGLFLGLALALKMMGWPILIYLALRRQWRAVFSAGAVLAGANLLSIMWLGLGWAKTYYLKIGPSVAAIYRSHEANYSIWTWGQRLFLGINLNATTRTAPIYQSETLARVTTVGLPFLALLIGLISALRMRDMDLAFCLLVVVSLLVSPVLWPHYFVVALLPLALWLRKTRDSGWPRRTLIYSAPALFVLARWRDMWNQAASGFAVNGVIPSWAGLIALTPVAALLTLAWLLWLTDTVTERYRSAETYFA